MTDEYWWDDELGSFSANIDGVLYGLHNGQYLTIKHMEYDLNIVLPMDIVTQLENDKEEATRLAIYEIFKGY